MMMIISTIMAIAPPTAAPTIIKIGMSSSSPSELAAHSMIVSIADNIMTYWMSLWLHWEKTVNKWEI